jgi:exo-beta-1,3-glucanase (GH17 family)
MNERIQELLKQATKAVDPENRVWVFSKVDQAKFAELIVRECISVINTEAAEVPVEDEYERMWKMGTEFAVYQIEKHFGVEE